MCGRAKYSWVRCGRVRIGFFFLVFGEVCGDLGAGDSFRAGRDAVLEMIAVAMIILVII